MQNLKTICEMPVSKRDLSWERKLFSAVADFPIYLAEETPFQGPDGLSYMHVSSEVGKEINKDDFFNWCLDSGVGVVLNLKEQKAPDFVFNYGMIWNFLMRGDFINEVPKDLKETDETYVHEISEGYLPNPVRENIKEFLEDNKIELPQITLLSGGDQTAYELLWYFPSLQDAEEKDQMALLEALSWFLPLDYRISWADSLEEELQFSPL